MSLKKEGCLIRQLPYIIEPVPGESSSPSPKISKTRSMNVTMAASTSSNSTTRFVYFYPFKMATFFQIISMDAVTMEMFPKLKMELTVR